MKRSGNGNETLLQTLFVAVAVYYCVILHDMFALLFLCFKPFSFPLHAKDFVFFSKSFKYDNILLQYSVAKLFIFPKFISNRILNCLNVWQNSTSFDKNQLSYSSVLLVYGN